MRLYELLARVDTISVCEDREVSGIVSDTRKCETGDVFVCIAGARFDGHSAAAEMLEKGASAVVVERDLGLPNQVVVPNSRAALSLMYAAVYGFPMDRLKLIGITGTSGKTSTSYMIKAMLDSMGAKTGLLGSIVRIVGDKVFHADQNTPEPEEFYQLLAMMAGEDCEYVIMEVSSQGLHQHRVEGCEFEAAVFTNLSQDHLDYHGSMESYLDAKKLLFGMARHAVTNADDPKGLEVTEFFAGEPLTYSIKVGSLTAEKIETRSDGVAFDLCYQGNTAHIDIPLPGAFSISNAMAAAGAVLSCGFSFGRVVEALKAIRGVPGRMEVIPTNSDFTILLDYAHKPDAMEKVLRTVRGFAQGRVVILFGCGGNRDKLKRPIMGKIAEDLADFVYVTSDNPRYEKPMEIIADILAGMTRPDKRSVICDRRQAIYTAVREHQPGDVLILAGKGHETYQLVRGETFSFDEREMVAGAMLGI